MLLKLAFMIIILHITFGYPCTVTAAPSQLTDPFSKIKKN